MQEQGTPQTTSGWQYQQEAVDPTMQDGGAESISWTASEFIAHEKDASWYITLLVGTVLIVAILYVLTRDFITAGMVVFVAIMFGVAANRKPRSLTYHLDEKGITIGGKTYGYQAFKYFSIVEEGAFHSILLMPLQRFMPTISIYYPPDQEGPVIDRISRYLPHQQHAHDTIDKLMRKIRF